MSVRLSGPPRRQGLPAVDRRLLRSRAGRILRALSHGRSELSISLVDDAEIAALNVAYRGRRGPTDVLAFSLLEGEGVEHRGRLLGDVVIGLEAAARQARARRRRHSGGCRERPEPGHPPPPRAGIKKRKRGLNRIEYKVLKVIYRFNGLKVGIIAKKLGIPHSTVGSCIKRLEYGGYVIYERYKPVMLSIKGKELAIELTRHARLLEILLINEFNMNPKAAHSECEKFNLLFSCEVINKICEKYGHPIECPCGDTILNSSKCYCKKE